MGAGEGEVREDFGARDIVDDKDEAAALVGVGPVVEPLRRKHRMLGRLHDGWPLRPVGEAHDPLDPQQVGAALASEAAQSAGEVQPTQCSFEDHAESIDAVGVGSDRLGRLYRSSREFAVAEQHRTGILGLGREDAVGAVIEGVETAHEVRAERREVGLGDHQSVGERGLPPCFGEAVEAIAASYRVDESNDPRQMQ